MPEFNETGHILLIQVYYVTHSILIQKGENSMKFENFGHYLKLKSAISFHYYVNAFLIEFLPHSTEGQVCPLVTPVTVIYPGLG